MSKYYRESKITDDPELLLDIGGHMMKPVHVDEWHPASEPPKPEDFEPTGEIQVCWPKDKQAMQMDRQQWREHFTGRDADRLMTENAHWRRITPPARADAGREKK